MSAWIGSFLLGTSILWMLVVASILLARSRTPLPRRGGLPKIIVTTGCLALVAQIVHFSEELNAGFDTSLPSILGLAPWPNGAFISVNVAFIGLWIVCLILPGRARRTADMPLWLLAVASCANAVLHPALSLWTEGYFPGLFTSPLVGLTGGGLLFALVRSTGWIHHEPSAKMS